MSEAKLRVLVVGQTPPPFHGQAVAIGSFLEGEYERVELSHVPMSFSRHIDEVGQLRIRKVFQLPWLVARIFWTRVRNGSEVLYYPPHGVERIPLVRDLVVLIFCRWAFRWTVFHLHVIGLAQHYSRWGRFWRYAFRKAYFRPDLVIAPSKAGEADGRFLAARHLRRVPNGVADDAASTAALVRVNAEPPAVFYAGVLRESKGIVVLLEACAKLKAEKVSFRVRLMGDFQPAGFKDELMDRIERLQLSSQVDLLGRRVASDKWAQFRLADVFCFPTLYDNFPLAVLEAMEFGLPVVATRCGALEEIVVEGETGYLVDPRDSDSLADRLEKLLTDSELRRTMGKAGRDRYVDLFTVEQYRRSLEDALCQVLAE